MVIQVGVEQCFFFSTRSRTDGPSSSCEMIILRNKSHGEILEFVWEYLRPLLGIKEYSQILTHRHLAPVVLKQFIDAKWLVVLGEAQFAKEAWSASWFSTVMCTRDV